jgi:hypothetical protein
MGKQLYGYSRDEHEYEVSIPQIMTDDGPLIICMSAHGGGTVGKSYAGNGWDYAVYDEDGFPVIEGSDLRSPAGRPAGHAEMARALASFLSDYGESFALAGFTIGDGDTPEYSPDEAEWLAANYERLGSFASEGEPDPCDPTQTIASCNRHNGIGETESGY